jgi:hypothetical protein
MTYFAVCSNPDCDGATPIPGGAALQYALEHPKEATASFRTINALLPKARRCEKCGSPLLFFCLHCRKSMFSSPGARHCMYCGKDIKMIPGSEGDRRKHNRPFKGPERRHHIDRRFGKRPHHEHGKDVSGNSK